MKPVSRRGLKAALKARDERIARLYHEHCSGITIPMMATVKIMEYGRTLYATGISEVEMGKAMRSYTELLAVK